MQRAPQHSRLVNKTQSAQLATLFLLLLTIGTGSARNTQLQVTCSGSATPIKSKPRQSLELEKATWSTPLGEVELIQT
jgi:hypothetical protein